MMHTKTVLQTLAIAGCAVAIPLIARATNATPGKSTGGSNSINEAFVNKGKLYYGNIADPGTLSNYQTQQILNADFGQITCEVCGARINPTVVGAQADS